jgi:hypothetical protein
MPPCFPRQKGASIFLPALDFPFSWPNEATLSKTESRESDTWDSSQYDPPGLNDYVICDAVVSIPRVG